MTIRQQLNNSSTTSLFSRLEQLRVITGKTWDVIAKELGVDRSLIFHVKAGSRNLSAKVVYRLEKAELAAGIASKTKPVFQHGLQDKAVFTSLTGAKRSKPYKVSASEIDQGYVEMALEYRRGSPPSGYPATIQISVPSNTTIWHLNTKGELLLDPLPLVLSCLPADYSKHEFVDKLTPRCYRHLVEITITLTFGLNWKKAVKVVGK